MAFHPEAHPGLNLELTWFGINYSDRVVEPITNFAEAMTNPVYAAFVDYTPTPDEQAAILSAAGVFSNYAGVPYDPDDVFAILYFQYVNASDQRIKGVDLSGEYALDVGAGHLTVRGSPCLPARLRTIRCRRLLTGAWRSFDTPWTSSVVYARACAQDER